jgi:hypothetical protein
MAVWKTNPFEIVTASEIGDYVFNPQVWRDRLTGKVKASQAVFDDGTRRHTRKEAAVHAATHSTARRILVIIAIILIAIWAVSR